MLVFRGVHALRISELGPVCPVEGKKTSPVLGSGGFLGTSRLQLLRCQDSEGVQISTASLGCPRKFVKV